MCVCVTDLNRSGRLLLLLAALTFFSAHIVLCVGSGGEGSKVQWQILTKFNYSSQIRLHPRLLLLVTVPWSGNSRALMKELAHVVASDEERFGSLKLMVLYRNVERMLADALGATDGITIFYHHNTISYKYGGRLRVQNILSSVHYVMSLSPDELPLKSLTTTEELRDFLHSTDKAVLLWEFCGWTPRLMAMNNTMNESDPGKGYLGADLNRGNNGTLAVEEKDNKKGEEDDKLSCAINNESSGIPWLSQLTFVNDSHVKEAQNLTFGAGESCTLYEFQQFKTFLQKLTTVARESFLPPERLRFAVVRDRSLLPLLNIEEPGSWMMTVYFAGCPSCSKVLKEVDDVRTVLQAQASPVLELEDDPQGIEAALPANRPTMLLFVDRSSGSMHIRRESQEALDALRELAQHTLMSSQIRGQTTIRPAKSSLETNRASQSTLKHPRLRPFPASQKLTIKDKMSIMIMNEGQQVTLENLVPDLQGSSLHEILTYVVKQKKELKLSSLAKDAGFQLLSKDFDIEVVESLPSNSEDQSNQISGETPVEEGLENDDIDKKQMPPVSSGRWHEGLPHLSDVEDVMLESKEYSPDQSSLSFVEPQDDHHSTGIAAHSAQGSHVDETRHSGMDENEQQKDFTGSFFFLDGEYRFLETLTGGSKIPSVVIIDPNSQQHYVLAEQSVFSYSSLFVFVNDFLNGKLLPYRQSAATVSSSRDAQRPPFVNLDFHETDSIPLVTTSTFAELVLGNNSHPKNSGQSWNRNVLVLFSNSWCGFCQRMELVVREVYRAVKSYANMKMNSSRKEKLMLTEYVEDDILKLPLIYMMDCTRNDCSFIVKPILQREVYPLLLLFPAERKNDTVSYEGDIAVSDIINFLAAHGSHVQDLIMTKSVLQDQNSVKQDPESRSLHHEVVLKDRLPNPAVKYQKINAQFAVGSQERPQLFAGCVLSATQKLLDAHPFDESKILIVKVDQGTRFQGLIINKHISWDSLEEGFELLKEAPLSFGGPVLMRGMPLVALTHKYIEGQSHQVLPNVYFVDQLGTLSLLEEIRVGNQSVSDYWFFVGYSSWGWEQLFNEIAQGAWNISKGNSEELEWPWKRCPRVLASAKEDGQWT
ncbi:Protein disulfide-isomerase [Handroanthus impetiginosus]|uniref:Protein disulfide-isomerase n=1 Tax=Handroanthus impetiginosus TaxID=429701 RepID=A0A2G9HC99_9LAMI|nr:Protein disulfide-isomerase [Handroanthus impetiginosus]